MKNAEIAQLFQEMAEMLAFLGENPFRVRAHTQAARTLADLETPIEAIGAQGEKALQALPSIGPDLAAKIQEYLRTGTIQAHSRLARQAGGMGIRFALSTDAHQLDHLRIMELAVGTAQRAWLGPAQILNTRPLAALLDWLRGVRG